uniref:Uncharacterized protein n=1 Tax=Anguilla anguilla TaxID=7936 RepID=A0A0E9R6I8_ANGAN
MTNWMLGLGRPLHILFPQISQSHFILQEPSR